MNKKCWIGDYLGLKVLFCDQKGITLEGNSPAYYGETVRYLDIPDIHKYQNITKEYLNNTKIKVESEEHSKFIQELAFSAGFLWMGESSKINDNDGDKICHLYFDGRYLTYTKRHYEEFFKQNVNKEIFLPLPPNHDKLEMSETKVRNITTKLKPYCYFHGEDDFLEVVEWVNGEGKDVTFNGKQTQKISLTHGEFQALCCLWNYCGG